MYFLQAKYEKRLQLVLEHLQIVRNHMELQHRASRAQQSSTNDMALSNTTSQSEPRINLTDQSAVRSSQVGVTSSQHGEFPNGDDITGNQSQNLLDGVLMENGAPDQSQALLDRLMKEDGAGDQSGSLKERVVERCRHKSGKVNSRRVLDILHMEDKKHQKVGPCSVKYLHLPNIKDMLINWLMVLYTVVCSIVLLSENYLCHLWAV